MIDNKLDKNVKNFDIYSIENLTHYEFDEENFYLSLMSVM